MKARLAVLTALALTGCGGPSAGEELADWRAKADGICERTEKTIREQPPVKDGEDLERVLVRAGEEARRATKQIRALELSDEARKKVAPVIKDLGLVEDHLKRMESAAATGDRKPIEKEARRLRLDAIDIGARAQRAGLKRCGREATLVAASDAFMMPSFAVRIARSLEVLGVETIRLSRRYDWDDRDQRARFWARLDVGINRAFKHLDGEYPMRLEDQRDDYARALDLVRRNTEYFRSKAEGEIPIADYPSEYEASKQLKVAVKAGVTLLRRSGVAKPRAGTQQS